MITELKIKNFRSLKDVELKGLQPVNLLIGPNNSGKSNILKALKFFGNVLNEEIPDKEHLQPLFFSLVKENELIESDLIALQFISELSDKNIPFGFGGITLSHYKKDNIEPSFAVAYSTTKDVPEQVSIDDVESLNNSFEDFELVYYNYSEKVPPTTNIGAHVSSSRGYMGTRYIKREGSINRISTLPDHALSYFKAPIPSQIFTPIHNLKIYRPEPSKLLELYPIQNEQSVNEDAGNLVAFLQVMRNRYQAIFDIITEDLRQFAPEFKSISFDLVDKPPKELQEKYNNKSLAKIGLTDIHGRIFWAESLSEGTLYFLSLLCIIHQPEPPKLLLLEEPEKGIHPRRIRETMDLIFELAEEKGIQVILTTHSTAVVDTFADIPEAVYIVEREGQETTVKNLQQDVIEPHNQQFKAAGEEPIPFTDALGEHWAMGFLGGVPDDND